MPIEGRSAEECREKFRAHIASLAKATIPGDCPVLVKEREGQDVLGFFQGDPVAIPLKTRIGTLHFSIGQHLVAVTEGRRKFRLRTEEYWYRLQVKPDLKEKAFLRWEYKSNPEQSKPSYCRHHVQMQALLGPGGIDLNKAHLPTGWVPVEEVIRFLIVELGVEPPCGKEWPRKLAESERAFCEEYAPNRCEP